MRTQNPEPIVAHRYDHTDIRPSTFDDPRFPFMFLADVAQENAHLFELQEGRIDNHFIAKKMKELGAVENGIQLEEEGCMFYAFFKSQHVGTEFLKKLSAWLSQKARLLEKARSY